MGKRKLKISLIYIGIALIVAGVVLYIREVKFTSIIIGGIGAIASLLGLIKDKKQEAQPIHLDLPLAKKLADETLVEKLDTTEAKLELRDKTIAELNELLRNKDNLPNYEQIALEFREKGQLQEAINSVDTNASDKEAADRHIFKAKLLIDAFDFDEAEQHYIKAADIFPSYDNNLAIAKFYYKLNMFDKAIKYYNHCLNLATSSEEKANVWNEIGNAQWKSNDYDSAEVSYNESLKTNEQTVEENPETYLPNMAVTLNNWAILHQSNNDYSKALEKYEKAMEILRKLNQENEKEYLPEMAHTLNNLGLLYSDTYDYPKASAQYEEAMNIYSTLVEESSKTYLPNLATTLSNWANLHQRLNKYSTALVQYQKALKIYETLVEENPKTYSHNVATTLHNLATLYIANNNYSKALEYYEKAIKIFSVLAEDNLEAYLPYVAGTFCNLSMLYQNNIPNKELSLQYANKAIEALDKCNDTPFVRESRERAKWIIEKWNSETMIRNFEINILTDSHLKITLCQ